MKTNQRPIGNQGVETKGSTKLSDATIRGKLVCRTGKLAELVTFVGSDGAPEIVLSGEDASVLLLTISDTEYRDLPLDARREYEPIVGQEGLKWRLRIADPKPELKPTEKRRPERNTRKSNVPKGIEYMEVDSTTMVEKKPPIWRLPSYTALLSGSEKKLHKRANKYLAHVQARISKAIANGEYKKAANLGLLIIQRSRVFTIYVLTKTCRGYFWELKEMDVSAALQKYAKFTRGMETSLTVKRFYIPKPNGKFRPIGAPNL